MAEDKKSATMFDLIAGVTDKKREWSRWSETDQKKFTPFIVNRWLSMRMELTELINEFQTYTIGQLSPRDTYRLYYDLLPTNKSFAKYIKGKSEDKYEKDLIAQIAEHYQVSRSEAVDYVDLMDKTQCDRILTMYGYSEGEKKKLLKGIK
ncbi:MAG TPA: hypothetical protein DEF82_04015 [Crocinitomicaceae bacterium]|nr:hypothetical protein [Crocinitomicaceae bacterium]